MPDDILILQTMVGLAGDIDLMGAFAASRKADIGHHRLAWAIDDAADDGNGHRRGDMGQAFFQDFDRLDDVEILAAQDGQEITVTPRRRSPSVFSMSQADFDFFDRFGGQRHADGVANARPQQHAQPNRTFHRSGA